MQLVIAGEEQRGGMPTKILLRSCRRDHQVKRRQVRGVGLSPHQFSVHTMALRKNAVK